jgi:hypothetical protein
MTKAKTIEVDVEAVLLTTSLYRLRKFHACESRYSHLVSALGEDYGDKTPINLLRILEANGVEDCLWALCATDQNCDMVARLMAADFAEGVLPLYEQRYPNDTRPRAAIQAARDYAHGRIGAAAWDAARDAARDAASAAAWDAARDAASAAARAAARDAARDAASAAAWDAAWGVATDAASAAAWGVAKDAARDAAWAAAWGVAKDAARAAARAAAWDVAKDAARAAARAAAWDAAWDAAWAAAWDVARDAQAVIIRRYLKES